MAGRRPGPSSRLAPQGVAGEDIIAPKKELDLDANAWALRSTGPDFLRHDPGGQRAGPVARTAGHLGGLPTPAGSRLYPQIARADRSACCFGLPGHHRVHPTGPTFRRLKAECSREELANRLADPAVKAAILSEDDLPPDPNLLFDNMFALRAILAWPGSMRSVIRPTTRPTDERNR